MGKEYKIIRDDRGYEFIDTGHGPLIPNLDTSVQKVGGEAVAAAIRDGVLQLDSPADHINQVYNLAIGLELHNQLSSQWPDRPEAS